MVVAAAELRVLLDPAGPEQRLAHGDACSRRSVSWLLCAKLVDFRLRLLLMGTVQVTAIVEARKNSRLGWMCACAGIGFGRRSMCGDGRAGCRHVTVRYMRTSSEVA